MIILLIATAFAVETNAVRAPGAPAWVTESRLNRIADHVEKELEWHIRRVTTIWHTDAGTFQSAHGYGDSVLAFARATDNTIHVGPRVTTDAFDAVFAHELVHAVLAQKYHGGVPKWLEEGLANHVAGTKPNYAWLKSQELPPVSGLSHPFTGAAGARLHYELSTAAIAYIASKCDLHDLLMLTTGAKMESYLSTFCGIEDIDAGTIHFVEEK